MVTAEQFLRRSLLAPLVILTIVLMTMGGFGWFILAFVVVLGFIPYLWMLWDKWYLLEGLKGGLLEGEIVRLPVAMLAYYAKLIGILAVVIALWGLLSGLEVFVTAEFELLCVALIGALAVPVVGYVFVVVTLVLLRIFQWLRLVD